MSYYDEHPIRDPHARAQWIPLTECANRGCKSKAFEAVVMASGVIMPFCLKHRRSVSTFIDNLNIKYTSKTEYKVISWNRSMEAAYNAQRKTGKPGYEEYLRLESKEGGASGGTSGGVQETRDKAGE